MTQVKQNINQETFDDCPLDEQHPFTMLTCAVIFVSLAFRPSASKELACSRACRESRLNSAQNSGRGLECAAYKTTGFCAPGRGMGLPWHPTCWGCQAIVWKK